MDPTPNEKIQALEKRVRQQAAELNTLKTELIEARAQAKKHFDMVQSLLRYELKIENKTASVAKGIVAGTNETFTA
jgi:hypothetical protein